MVAWPRQRFVYQSNCHVRPTSAMATGVASGWGDGSSETWNQHQALHSCSNENPEAPGARRSLGYLQPRMEVSVGHCVQCSLIWWSWVARCYCTSQNFDLPCAVYFWKSYGGKQHYSVALSFASLVLWSICLLHGCFCVVFLNRGNTSSTHDFPSQRWFAHGDFAIFCHDSQFWFPCIPGFPAFSHYFSAFCP